MKDGVGPKPAPSLRNRYPHLTDEELALAEDNLKRYLTLVREIFERIEAESRPQADPLTQDMGTLSSGTPENQGPTA